MKLTQRLIEVKYQAWAFQTSKKSSKIVHCPQFFRRLKAKITDLRIYKLL
jgi:hypothetical protein